jgi:hypothetical protein
MKRRVAQGLAAIMDNPIAVREWRLLRRRAGNWRVWVQMKSPLDPIVWGVPVILAFSVAACGLWAILACLRGFHVMGNEKVPFDFLLLLALAFWFYVEAISMILGATAITHEREQERWDQLCLTGMSKRERAAGFLWGRLGPVWASALVTSVLWWLLLPSYLALLAAYVENRTSRSGLALGTLVGLGVSPLVGKVGLLNPARFKSTAAAVVMAVLLAVPVGLLGALCLLGTVMTVWEFNPDATRDGLIHQATRVLFLLFLFYALFVIVKEALENRLEP